MVGATAIFVTFRGDPGLRPIAVVEKNPGQYMLTNEVVVEIEGSDKPALKAVWLRPQAPQYS